MKKILITRLPIIISIITLLIVTCFLRYNLYVNSTQLSKEFLTQNAHEIYSIDSLKLSSRLNSFSRAINWVCIQGEVNHNPFFSMKRGNCSSSFLQQKVEIHVPEANNIKISFTLKLSKDLEFLFSVFLLLQLTLIISLIFATKKSEDEKRQQDLKFLQLSRKMFHDIRSPLASLNMIAHDLHFSKSDEENIFKNSISRINDIANSLLENTKKEAVPLPFFQDISQIVVEIVNEKKKEYALDHASIQFSECNKSQRIMAFLEAIEFKRILSNLINNSIEACEKNPKIEIKTQIIGENFVLDIIDNGKGVPQKILSKLGLEEVTTKKKGNGLGLKDAFDSLKEWNGNLEIFETSAKGTTLRLTFQSKIEPKQYYLIDDDELVRMTWEIKANKARVSLLSFSSYQKFLEIKNDISKEAFIYIDSELGEMKGEAIANDLHNEGFTNLSITTGYPAENFKTYHFLKSVISKVPPF